MSRYREREERLRLIEAIRRRARQNPHRCVVCMTPCEQQRALRLVDFMGGTGADGTLDCTMCDECVAGCRQATSAILTSKARRD